MCKLPSTILCFFALLTLFSICTVPETLYFPTWTVSVRWALCERWAWTERSGERKWTHCERTVNAWKNGKVERFSDSIWYFCIYIVYISFVFFVALIWNIKTNLVHISNAENTHVYEMYMIIKIDLNILIVKTLYKTNKTLYNTTVIHVFE